MRESEPLRGPHDGLYVSATRSASVCDAVRPASAIPAARANAREETSPRGPTHEVTVVRGRGRKREFLPRPSHDRLRGRGVVALAGGAGPPRGRRGRTARPPAAPAGPPADGSGDRGPGSAEGGRGPPHACARAPPAPRGAPPKKRNTEKKVAGESGESNARRESSSLSSLVSAPLVAVVVPSGLVSRGHAGSPQDPAPGRVGPLGRRLGAGRHRDRVSAFARGNYKRAVGRSRDIV